MKTHLPIALRKALLAAIFAVPVMTHSIAHADDVTNVVNVNESNSSEAYTYSTSLMSDGSSVKFKDGTVSVTLIEGKTTINSSGKGNINVKNQITGGNGTVLTSCGGTIAVGTILGTNTKISNTGDGTVEITTINGSGTQIETVNGNVTTGYISKKTTIKTQNGDVTTGSIYTDDGSETTITTGNGDVTAYKISTKTTITSTGAGNIEITNGIEDTTDYADGEVGTSITSQGGNITIGKTETNGTISVAAVNGENTVISTTGNGTITTGAIVGAGTQIETKYGDGAVSTGVIYGADTTIKTEDGAVTTVAISAADTKITSTGAGSIKVDGYIREAAEGTEITGAGGAITTSVIAGTNTEITNTGNGTIETGYISGADTTITTEDGAVTTGGIYGADTTIKTKDGAVTTGDISGDDTTIDVVNGAVTTGEISAKTTITSTGETATAGGTGVGEIEVGAISGEGTQIKTVDANVTTGSISGADTTITSTGAGAIKVNGNIQRTAEGTKIIGAGGAITTSVIAGTNTEITNTGDGTIETGNISGDDTTINVVNGAVTTGGISGDDTTIDVVNGAVTTGEISAKTTITSTGETATAGGTGVGEIEVGAIFAAGTQIKTVDANVTTGGISGAGTQITTENGAVTTGKIYAKTTITSTGRTATAGGTGVGEIEVGDIVSAGTQINTVDANVTTGKISAKTTITSTGAGNIEITGGILDTAYYADGEVGTSITSQGGNILIGKTGTDGTISVKSVDGENTVISTTGDGTITTGSIVGDGTQITTGNGAVTTGDIFGDDTTITTEDGAVTTGDISGAGTQIETQNGDVTTGEISAKTTIETENGTVTTGRISADTTIISTGSADIKTGDISVANTTLESQGMGDVIVGELEKGADSLSITTKGGSVTIASINIPPLVNDEVDELNITTEGTGGLEIGLSTGALANATLNIAGGIVLGGDTPNQSETIVIRGMENKDGKTDIKAGGSITVNQSAEILSVDGRNASGNVNIVAQGDIKFLGNKTKISDEGSEAVGEKAFIKADGDIRFENAGGTTITDGAVLQGGGILLLNEGSSNDIAGDLYADGKVEIEGSFNRIYTNGGDVKIYAGDSITITAIGGAQDYTNTIISNGDFKATRYEVKITGGDVAEVSDSSITSEQSDVEITSGAVWVSGSIVSASNTVGDVTIAGIDDSGIGTALLGTTVTGNNISIGSVDSKTSIGSMSAKSSSLVAQATLEVKGKNVNISGDTSVESENGSVTITATGADDNNELALNVQGGSITAGQNVTLSAAAGTAALTGVLEIKGSAVGITGEIVDIVDNTVISATDGNVGIKATNGSASVAGGSVTSTNGSVTISGTIGTTVKEGVQVQAGTDVTIDGDTTAANTITGADTQLYAGGAVSLNGKNNTITNTATMIGMGIEGVKAVAEANNMITDGGKVFALNDDASVSLTAGVVNQIAGASTVVYAGKDTLMTAKTVNVIDAAKLTAKNGSLTMRNDAGSVDTLVNSIQNGATVASGTDVAMTGGINNILSDSSVTATANVTLTGATQNAISESTVKAGTDVTLTGDQSTVNNVITGGIVTVGNDVAMTGKNNTITAASAVNAGNNVTLDAGVNNVVNGGAKVIGLKGVEITAGADNTINGGAQVLGYNDDASVSITAVSDNLIAGAATKVYAGRDVDLTAESTNTIYGATVTAKTGDITMGNDAGSVDTLVNSIQNGAEVAAGAAVSMKGAINNIQSDSHVTAINGSVTMTGATQNAISESTVKAGTDVTLTGDQSTVNNVITGGIVTVGNDVAMTGKNNSIASTSTVKAGTDVQLNAGENNVIAGASTVTATDNAELTADASNYITGVSELTAGTDVTIKGEVNNTIDASTVTAVDGTVSMRNADDTAAGVKNFINDAEVIAGAAVSMKGAINNIQSDSHVTAIDGSVTMTGATQNAISESTVKAGKDVTLTGDKNAILTGSIVTATDKVTMTGATQNAISESTVKAGTDVTLTGDQSTVNNVITGGIVTVGNDVAMTGKNNTITAASAVNAGNNVTLDAGVNNVVNGGAKVTAKGSVDMDAVANNIISDSDTQVYAVHTVSIEGENNVITKEAKVIGLKGVEITAATDNTINAGGQVLAMNDDASVSISAGEDNLIAGSTSKVYAGKDVTIKGEAANTVYAATVSAKTGDITMSNDAGDTDAVVNTITATAKVTAAGDVSMVGDKNAILVGSTVTAGMDVTLTADTQNAVANSAVTAKHGDITMGDVDGRLATVENVVTSEAGKTTTLKAGEDVSIMGYNVITAKDKGGTSITAENGNITVTDSNYIKYAVIDAEGDVSITTGTGDKRTWIEDTTISGETVTIAGDTTTTTTTDPDRSTENLAVVKGSDTVIYSWGDDNGAGITLNNVSVVDTEKDYPNIKAHGDGDIVILNRVDLGNATLTIDDGENSDARIVVYAGNVLNTCEASSLEGRLTGTGDINKSGGDELLLDYDHTEFNGTIYANGAVGGADGSVLDGDNAGSWIKITDTNVDDGQKAGVGCGASIVLKNTDLVISTTEARIGTLDTTQDTEQNNAATGDALLADGSYTPTLLADGSYTTDDNLRADFKTVGSVLEVNMEEVGDSVKSSNLKLSDATLIKLNAAVAADGSASSDKIEALGTIDVAARAGLNSTSTAAAPSTARVYIRHNDKAATAAEGARTTIMQGTMVTDINEDVLYDVAASGNGTYQRKLQERNVHLENKGDHVDLVYSKNYRSSDKTPQMQQVANALRQISDTFHHHEGTLAASSNRLHNLIDAFDYTRSEGAAQRGLQSVAGTANVLPRLMMFDASRRHLENLREQIQMPDCPDASGKAGTELRSSNAWMTYTGAYDSLNGDAYLDDYTRTGHGIMAGIDHSVRCNLRLGLSLGYEESIGRAENARVDAETFFVDAYAAGVTGRFKHRASIGLATGSYDTERNVLVDAGYHTFVGKGEGSVDSLTVNFGYEISTDIALNDSSWLTPYAALNLSWHSTDDLRESGMGEAGLVSSYGNEWQSELIFGVSYKHQFSAVPNQAPAMFYANAAMHLELFNDRVVLKNRFIGSPVGWRAESMNREPLYFELGAGVAVPLTPSWTATAGGSVEFGSERSGVSGNVGVRYQF